MTKQSKRKLALKKETVRHLIAQELGQVVGGGGYGVKGGGYGYTDKPIRGTGACTTSVDNME